MGTKLIRGVYFYPLKPIITTGGSVFHAIKNLDKHLPQFGECYFSTAKPLEPKAWKKHSRMICNLFVPSGSVKFIFYDDNSESDDFERIVEFTTSPSNYGRLVIEPGIWFGFSGLGGTDSIILNLASIPHDPQESLRIEPDAANFPFSWATNLK